MEQIIITILAAIGTVIFWVRWNDSWKLYQRITNWQKRAHHLCSLIETKRGGM
ncbi:MAG: hypothetical protein MUP17_09395 [candidate division Zixibacteria bacterium]|nr:hypothetical protein [candidate division Zixibacteria bacterium]